MVIIGYSLPPHDDYARQVIYRLVTNYQDIPAERLRWDSRQEKEAIIFVDLCETPARQNEVRERYRFIDWSKVHAFFSGFNEEVIAAL